MNKGVKVVPARKASGFGHTPQRYRSSISCARGFALFQFIATTVFLGAFVFTMWSYYHASVNPAGIEASAHNESSAVAPDIAVSADETPVRISGNEPAPPGMQVSGEDPYGRHDDFSAAGSVDTAGSYQPGRKITNPTGSRLEAVYAKSTAQEPTTSGKGHNDVVKSGRVIAGKVLDRNGEPLAGVTVTASVKRFFGESGGDDGAIRPDKPSPVYKHKTVSRDDGSFTFKELDKGDYLLKAVSGNYLPASITVRAGTDEVNLVLSRPRIRHVGGIVTNQSGQSLSGVKVLPNLRSAEMTESDDEGRYRAELPLVGDVMPDSIFIRFRHEGYREQLVRIDEHDWHGLDSAEFDISMVPVNDVAIIAGTVRNVTGGPVPGETVALHSPGLWNRYEAVTDSMGAFLMQNVDIGDDYSITVRPRRIYKDFHFKPLLVRADLMNLDVLLEPLDTAVLAGQMVDAMGNPVTGFTLQLRSERAAGQVIEVKGDHQGYFRIENAPRDSLFFETWSYPRFRITNVSSPGNDDILPLVLDWGNHELYGQVQNSLGEPVSMSQIHLTWAHTYKGIRSVSTRKTVADAAGNFRFSQVGPGRHTISVNAPGFETSRMTHETGVSGNNRVLVRLQRKLL